MNSPGGSWATDERAVSDVLGVALLVSMVIVGAVVVVVLAGTVIDSTEEDLRTEVVQQSFMQLDGRFEELKLGGGGTAASVSLPENRQGDATVRHTTTVNLTANADPTCTTGPVDLGTIIYENNGGEVAYEAGGVWRRSSTGGSTVVTPPDIQYRNGRLALSVADIQGPMAKSQDVSAQLDAETSRRMTEHLSRALVTNKTAAELTDGTAGPAVRTCSPSRIDNVTLRVNGSRYAGAWHRFAHDHYDDRRVTVHPGRGDRVEAGDTVVIRFMLGQTASPDFEVTDVDADYSVAAGDDADVNVTVGNTGDLPGSTTVELGLYDNSTAPPTAVDPSLETWSVSLNGSENETHAVTIPGSVTGSHPNTELRYSIDTGDEVHNGTLHVGSPGAAPPLFEVTALSAPSDAAVGSNVALTATVANTPGNRLVDRQTVTFEFDGTVVATESVEIDGGDTETVTFSVPTLREAPGLTLNVSTENDYRTAPITIGDAPYFAVESATAPATVPTGDAFRVNATINNTGERSGSDTVSVTVRNASTGALVADTSVSRSLDGTMDGPHDLGTANLSVGGIADAGHYNYTVETTNETTSGNVYVGQSADPFFQATEAEHSPSIVEPGETLTVEATINNTGTVGGTQTVELRFDGTDRDHRTLTLPAAGGSTVTLSHTLSAGQSVGYYNYTIETDNSSVQNSVQVVANRSNALGNAGGNTISVNENITARIELLGTELTAYWYGDVYRDPIQMAVYTDNSSAPNQYHYVWGQNEDLNSPSNREHQVDGDPFVSRTVRVAAGTNVSVYAKSFLCGGYQDSGIDRTVSGIPADSYRCADWDDPGDIRIDINQNANPSNLVILSDGEVVPNYQAAEPDQRSAAGMLGPLIDANGRLNLSTDQRVLLYELSEPGACPCNAGGSGDPDYNDGVVLFEVVNHSRTVDATGPADFAVSGTEAPVEAAVGSDATFRVNVTNRGERQNDTDVEFYVDGSLQAINNTGTVAGDNSTWVEFDIPTGIPTGPHELRIELARDRNETATRNVMLGSDPDAYFLPNVEDHTATVTPSDSVEVEVNVTNVGDSTGNQTVSVSAAPGDPVTPSTKTWAGPELNLSGGNPGEGADRTFVFVPTATGTATITVATDNATTTVPVRIGTPNFAVDHVAIGDTTYGDGDAIVRTDLTSLSAVVHNTATHDGTQQVDFVLENATTGTVVHDPSPRTVSLRGDEVEVIDFGLGPHHDVTGRYTYTVSTADDTQTGTIQIVSGQQPADPNSGSSELISINMNQITLGSGS